MNPPEAILILTGAMASGKSTVAELLAREFPKRAHVRSDLFTSSGRWSPRVARRWRRNPPVKPKSNCACGTGSRRRLPAYFEAGFTVVVQDMLLGECLPELLAPLRGETVFAVALRPRPEVVMERESERNPAMQTAGPSRRWTKPSRRRLEWASG